MSKKNKQKKKKASQVNKSQPATVVSPLPPEERSAELVTVAWMLCTLLTLVAVVLHGGATAYLYFYRAELAERHPLYSLMIVLNFIALFAGLFALVLIPLVYKLRVTKPPFAITIFAALVGTFPWAWLLVRLLRVAFAPA